MREVSLRRDTAETKISLTLSLDGRGVYDIETGCGFLNHMLELFARHGRFDLKLRCAGDVRVDFHHTTEDVGIVLGSAFGQALGEGRGIVRYGSFLLPMDETLVLCAVDLSGRGMSCCDLSIPAEKVGDFDTELVTEFFTAFCRTAGANLHLKQLSGVNSHHIIEAAFKGFGRAMKQAAAIDPDYADEIPSTKGVL